MDSLTAIVDRIANAEEIKVGDHVRCWIHAYKRALVERIDFDEQGFKLLSVKEGQKYGVVRALDCKVVD